MITHFDGVTATDNIYWIAVYKDGSFDIEEKPSNFPKIKFDKLDHFTLWPITGDIAICIIKNPKYRLIWRKQRYVTTRGVYLGSDYMMGLDPDDGSDLIKKIECGKEDPYYSPTKCDPKGFRIWLTKEGNIKTAGAFNRTERIYEMETKNGKRKIKYITCEIL